MTKIFVTRKISDAGLRKVLEAFPDTKVWPGDLPPTKAELIREVPGCVGILSLLTDPIDGDVMDAAGPQLRVISNFAVGYNNIDVRAAAQRGILVGNTPGVLTDATADMAFMLLLSAARRLGDSQAYARAGQWRTWEPLGFIGQDFKGKTLGIVGMGRIGTGLAERCKGAFGMRVLYSNRGKRNEAAEKTTGATLVSLDRLLAESDFVSVHCDLNPSTKGMFNASLFKQMRPNCVFINTARGPIVNQTDLCEALNSGTIFAAGLDVTDPEPLPASDPLYRARNCIVAPHIASATKQTRDAMATISADNLIAGVRGEKLRFSVALPKSKL